MGGAEESRTVVLVAISRSTCPPNAFCATRLDDRVSATTRQENMSSNSYLDDMLFGRGGDEKMDRLALWRGTPQPHFAAMSDATVRPTAALEDVRRALAQLTGS